MSEKPYKAKPGAFPEKKVNDNGRVSCDDWVRRFYDEAVVEMVRKEAERAHDDLIGRNVGNEREHAKIKTNFAKIIVEGTAKEPYYSILYYDPKRKEYINGYGSCYINYVFKWLAEEFEINNDTPAVPAEPVQHGRWIVDKERLIAECSERGKNLRFSDVMQISFSRDNERFCYYCGAKMDGGNDE